MIHPNEYDDLYFATLEELDKSEWLSQLKQTFMSGSFPKECGKCEEIEKIGQTSIREHALSADQLLNKKSDYLIAEVFLDNICNGGCSSCNMLKSTKIGSLHQRDYIKIDRVSSFRALPQDRLVQIDLTGGEPSASANCIELMNNLPPNVTAFRINTNGSLIIKEIPSMVEKGIEVNVTISFDGVGLVHNYVRWPLLWDKLLKNIIAYSKMPGVKLTLWTTISAINVNDLDNILKIVEQYQLNHSSGFLFAPLPLNARYSNSLTLAAKEKYKNSENETLRQLSNVIASGTDNQMYLDAFITKQDALRNISITDYLINRDNYGTTI